MSDVAQKVYQLVQPIAESLGLELYDVEYQRKSNGMNLTVFIDKEGGVNISDCEKLHNAIDAPLDELDPTNGASYVLNVSSPGLDRPLKTQKDFQRNLGKKISVGYYTGKPQVGVLTSFDENSFVLDVAGEQIKIEIKKTAHIVPVLEF